MKRNGLLRAAVLIGAIAMLVTAYGCEGILGSNALDGLLGRGKMLTTAASVEPIIFDPWNCGEGDFECAEVDSGSEYAYRIEATWAEGDPSGVYTHAGNTISITGFEIGPDCRTFDWESEYPVSTVIVVGGGIANVFYYSGAYSDTDLYAPDCEWIDHVTLCFDEPNMCYEEETAWAAGARYVSRGNWATYVAYAGVEKTVDVFAGRTMLAGTATFSAPFGGFVDITIELANGFVFYGDPEDDNIKVQDYENAPSGNPAPGKFDSKAMAAVGSTSYTITVPENNFYGVHLDVAYAVPCE
ncbi:MAG TPA: hypothetical protein VMZ31_04395 [Phycisphaerae bacterium]|nr:hypothetical protein [Phycisphaerae bacterium]